MAVQENAVDVIGAIVGSRAAAASDGAKIVNARDGMARIPLHYAAAANAAEAVEELIGWRTDVSARDEDGKTALHYAVEKNAAQAIRILIGQKDIDANLKDEKGEPLFITRWSWML